jgi:hypothetical protein
VNKYCKDLVIPVAHPLKDPSVLNQTGSDPEIWFADADNINPEFAAWLDSLGLVMTYPPLMFYTPPAGQCGIHIDGFGVTDRACMNFIVQGVGSLMHWYSLNPTEEITEQVATQADTPYTLYQPEQVTHVHSQPVRWPSLVQTGVPHNITNHTKEPRWCISCDISRKSAPEAGLTWNEITEIFKDYDKSNSN